MNYRELGRTRLTMSEIGLGCEGFVGKDDEYAEKLFQMVLGHGVNCMDLYSPNPDLRSQVGKLLRGRRSDFIMQAHLCTVWQDGQYKVTRRLGEVKGSFEDLLSRLETNYIDIGMIHYVDSISTWREIATGDVMRYAQEQKAAGRIHFLGLSSHNPEAALEAVGSGLIDVLLFSINPCYDLLPGDEDCEALWADASYQGQLLNMDPQRKKLYETCQRLGVGITVMKAFGGGTLLSEASPAGKALTVNQCLHYALTRPAVASVMVGARTVEELAGSLAYETATDTERDYAGAFATFPRISWDGHCMYCGHCAPCPRGIDVATVTKYLNLAESQVGVPETVREHYAGLTHHADECIQCGACEGRCPFGVSVRENMARAKATFGK